MDMEFAFFICYLSSSLVTDREFLMNYPLTKVRGKVDMSEVHVSFLFALDQQ